MRIQCKNRRWFLQIAVCSGIVIILTFCISVLQIFNPRVNAAQRFLDARFQTLQSPFFTESTSKKNESGRIGDRLNAIDVIALEAELVAIDNAVRMEVDQYEFVRSDELTRKERQTHLTSPAFPMERDAAMDKMRIALVNGGFSQNWKDGPTLKKSTRININTASAAVVFENLRIDFSAVLLSYYSIRNGYVRRRVPDTTKNTARLTNSIRPHLYNVRFNAFYSAHSRDFHTDNLKFQRTITTGGIHRAVELCLFDLSRV